MPAKGTPQTWHCLACGQPFKCVQYKFHRRYCSPECRPSQAKRTGDVVETVCKMWREGKTYFAIAKTVGAADRTVARWVDELCTQGVLQPRSPNRQRLTAERIARNRQEMTKRNCLSCSAPFMSDGPGNRICMACKDTSAWRSGCSYGFAA